MLIDQTVTSHYTEGRREKMKIAETKTLQELLNAIMELSDEENELVDWSSFPVFGGEEPNSTSQVWSWDGTSLLVGTCRDDLKIVPRE
jgi:hypothetical protein